MSLDFPNIFYKNSTRVLEGAEGIKNDLALALQCEKREQLGDPDFGTDLHKARFKTNTSLAAELAIDGVIEAQKFVGNVLFYREDVVIKKTGPGVVDITIDATFSTALNKKELLLISGVEVD